MMSKMKDMRFPLLSFFLLFTVLGHAQMIQQTGDLFAKVASNISTMPGDSGNQYSEPNQAQLNTWENTLKSLLAGDYSKASDSANSLKYRLFEFTDTTTSPSQIYYLLEVVDTNYWGTYVYNPNYCRRLVIQSPHAKRDANTGHQGIHVFIQTQSWFYQVNGTHRCNSSAHTSCTGTTTSCSSTSASEPYRISDLAHTTQSLFQKTTEVLFQHTSSSYFIQLHGFSKQSTDPYAILSNGTQEVPAPDYFPSLRDHLYQEDTVLTFKIAHIDTNWTRLRGFWNTQGRMINGGSDPCQTSATATNGRFFHIEQERIRLRSNSSAWDKMAIALKKTFVCGPMFTQKIEPTSTFKLYPNPAGDRVTLTWQGENNFDSEAILFNLVGQNQSERAKVIHNDSHSMELDLSTLPKGVYLLRLNQTSIKLIKK